MEAAALQCEELRANAHEEATQTRAEAQEEACEGYTSRIGFCLIIVKNLW